MSKEHKFNEKIIHALSNISIKFDELGFVPTTLNDEHNEYFVDWFSDEVKIIREESSKQDKTISDLEAKLAEKQKFVEALHLDTNEFLSKIIKFNEVSAENKELKQQLAEKEKYTYTGKEVGRIEQNYENQLAEKEKEIEEYKRICTIAHVEDLQIENMLLKGKAQDKISFAVEKLEETRKLIANLDMPDSPVLYNDDMFQAGFDSHYVRTRQTIDNQIKQLKEGN